MGSLICFLTDYVRQLMTLMGKIKGRFSPLLKILVYIYLDLNLFLKKREITEYYYLNTLNIFFGLRRYKTSFIQIKILRAGIYYFKTII